MSSRAMRFARIGGFVTILTSVAEVIALLVRGVGLNPANGATLLLALVAGVLAIRATQRRSLVWADALLLVALAPTMEWPFFAPSLMLLIAATVLSFRQVDETRSVTAA
jgi:hypothetical protein